MVFLTDGFGERDTPMLKGEKGRDKWLLFIILTILSILIVLPAFIHGYIYPNTSDDTAFHLAYFRNMDIQSFLYYGQYLVGKLVNALPFNPATTFLWFNYIAFILVVWAIGISVSLAVGCLVGVVATILAIFGITASLQLFQSGMIFDLIGIGILLPLLLLCLHNIRRNIGWKFGFVFALISFAFFHLNGLYLLALIPIVIVYEIIRDKVAKRLNEGLSYIWNNRFLVYLLGLVAALFFAYVFRLGGENSGRLIFDLMIPLIIFVVAVLFRLLLFNERNLRYVFVLLAFIICIPNFFTWFHDNSAVKEVDKQAITYLNSLPDGTYTASPQVTELIYELFVDKQFIEDVSADYAVVRNVPMTFTSDPENINFKNQDRMALSMNGFQLEKQFNDGGIDPKTNQQITVSVFKKMQ
jgi:MFS family permease